MRILKAIRNEAIWLAAIEASNDPFMVSEMVHAASEQAKDLYKKCWIEVIGLPSSNGHEESHLAIHKNTWMVGAEIEALLQNGWSPGDVLYWNSTGLSFVAEPHEDE